MLIGLNGRAGSGKDTAYAFLADSGLLPRVRREAFADRLKVSAARALGFDGTWEECIEFCNTIKQPPVGIVTSEPGRCLRVISGREFLQRYGTEAHREVFHEDFWINACLPMTTDHEDETIVVTDVRFPNEARRIKALGGYVWKIIRPYVITESSHASERDLPEELVDATILNDGTLLDLKSSVYRLARLGVNFEASHSS